RARGRRGARDLPAGSVAPPRAALPSSEAVPGVPLRVERGDTALVRAPRGTELARPEAPPTPGARPGRGRWVRGGLRARRAPLESRGLTCPPPTTPRTPRALSLTCVPHFSP